MKDKQQVLVTLPMKRLRTWYIFVSVIAFNFLLLLLLVNILLYAAKKIQDSFEPERNPIAKKYSAAKLKGVYPGWADEDLKTLLRECWSKRFQYEPFNAFKEIPRRGKFVNVDSNGFRWSEDQGPWPPDTAHTRVVFVFGGSTTFGYGLPDNETIPSRLQSYLNGKNNPRPFKVYNFGRGHYFSTQELIQFEKLLAEGYRPHIAVFIDGLNDLFTATGEPGFNFTEKLLAAQRSDPVWLALRKIPMVRTVESIQSRIRPLRQTASAHPPSNILSHRNYLIAMRNLRLNLSPGAPRSSGNDDFAFLRNELDTLDRILNRIKANHRMIESISRSFGLRPLLVLQPIPEHNYPSSRHAFRAPDHFKRHTVGYSMILERGFASEGESHLNCSDIQEKLDEPLYVDLVHYNAKLSGLIAECIASRI